MLLAECDAGGVQRRQPCAVREVRRAGDGFELATDDGLLRTPRLVVATGGSRFPRSAPQTSASGSPPSSATASCRPTPAWCR